jgi:transcriptional regulator with XRE-family HTH domain
MEKGLSKSSLAQLIGVTAKTIGNIERGTGGKPETIRKIADALSMDLASLVIDDTEQKTA